MFFLPLNCLQLWATWMISDSGLNLGLPTWDFSCFKRFGHIETWSPKYLQSQCPLVKSHVTGDCYHMFNMIISIEQVFLPIAMLTKWVYLFLLKNIGLGKTSSQLPKHLGLTFPFASRPLAKKREVQRGGWDFSVLDESKKYRNITIRYEKHWISIWNCQVVVWMELNIS